MFDTENSLFKELVSNPIPAWNEFFLNEFQFDYFKSLAHKLHVDLKSSAVVFPVKEQIFEAFKRVAPNEVKVVILGQDPYHGKGQAHGLAFSVNHGIKVPPSLKNIFKELNTDLSIDIPSHGCLTQWANQGVLLLNASLTVLEGQPASHAAIGWEKFTDHTIEYLSLSQNNLVFLLWGKFAQSKAKFIDKSKHLVLEAAHPSPLARNAFAGCKHFSKANQYLLNHGKNSINWKLDK